MRSDLVVAFAGRMGTGKSSLSCALAEELGWKHASFGAFLRTVAVSRGLDPTRNTLQIIGEEMERADPNGFCRVVLEAATWHTADPLVVDGVRHVEILELLRQMVAPQPFFFIYLEADEATRRSRLEHRGAGDAKSLPLLEAHSTEHDVLTRLPELADLTLPTAAGSEIELLECIKSHLRLQRELQLSAEKNTTP